MRRSPRRSLVAALLALLAVAGALLGAPVTLTSWTAGHAKPASALAAVPGALVASDLDPRGASAGGMVPGPGSGLSGEDAPGGSGLVPLPAAPAGPADSSTDTGSASAGSAPAGSPGAAPVDGSRHPTPLSDDVGGLGPDRCVVRPTRPVDGFDPFYGQVCWTLGIPVLASADVDRDALVAAARIVTAVLGPRPELVSQLVRERMRVAVLGVHQRAVELPEYRDLPSRYPATNWDGARAYSATAARPLLSAPEENLTCSPDDTYPGQQVLVHELGHSVMDLGVRAIEPGLWDQVQRAYDRSVAAGRWVGYYGGTSATEYWAEGVQAYFGASRVTPDPDPLGTPVGSRGDLAGYDPALLELVRAVFGDNPWRAACP